MTDLVIAIFQLVLMVGAAYGFTRFFPGNSFKDSKVEYFVIRIALGFGLLAFITLLAASMGFVNLVFFITFLMLGNGLALEEIWKNRANRPLASPGEKQSTPAYFFILPAAFVAVNLFYSLFPPSFYDSMLYHLAIPQYYILNGGIVPWETNFNSGLPLNVEMIFLFSLLGKTVHIPRLISFLSGLGIMAILFSWYSHRFEGKIRVLPLLLFYTIPQIGFLTSSAKTDITGMLFLLIGVRLFFYYLDNTKGFSMLVYSGLFWGLALGTKYIFAFYLVGFFVALLFYKPLEYKKKLISVLIVGVMIFLCLVPWFVKNTVITGNPVYPYLNSVFPAKHWTQVQAESFSTTIKRGKGHSLGHYLLFPIKLFLIPYSYGMTAVMGILFLVFLPFMFFAWRSKQARLLIMTGIFSFVLLMPFAMVPRYFLASFLLFSIPMARGIEKACHRFAALKIPTIAVLVLLSLANMVLQVKLQEEYSNSIAYLSARWSGKINPRNHKYLYMLPYYRAVEFLNSHMKQDGLVLFLGEDPTFYMEKKFLASSFNDRNPLLELLRVSTDFEGFFGGLRDLKIDHILYYPRGLERFERMSPVYTLQDKEKLRLTQYLGHFPIVYKDQHYQIYKISRKSD